MVVARGLEAVVPTPLIAVPGSLESPLMQIA
jgi:hypothetical protein